MKAAIVSIYPPIHQKHSNAGGVASYSKNLVSNLASNLKIIVIADKINENEDYLETNNIYVKRCWDKGLFYPLQIARVIFEDKKGVDVVHIQHEFFLYGKSLSAGIFPLMLLLIRFIKPIVVTFHGVIPLSKINNEFLKENGFSGNSYILKLGLYTIIKLSSFFINRIIVHEKSFKQILCNDYGISSRKIDIIPHGIESRNDKKDADEAKNSIGLKNKCIILFMGYLTGYKGLDLLIDAFEHIKKQQDLILLIVGGEHPRLKDDRKYLKYIKKIRSKAKAISDNIIFTGFAQENEIPIYFSAADVVVFPYTIAMSSSGPMSMAIAYEKPIIVSQEIKASLGLNELAFRRNPKELAKKIEEIINSDELKEKAILRAKDLRIERYWETIAKNHEIVYLEATA